MKSCIFCNKQEDIEVEMVIKTDGGKATIFICKEHAESATQKTIKKAYDKRQKSIAELRELAKQHGLVIVDTQEQKMSAPSPVPASPTDPARAPALRRVDVPRPNQPEAPIVGAPASTSVVTKAPVANVPVSDDAPRYAAHEIDQSKAPKIIRQTERVIENSEGIPIRIPEKIVSEAGVTSITIVQSETDATLKRRTQEMARALNVEVNANTRPGKGYTARDCALCGGTGQARVGGQICPRCKGSGLMG
jgi:hypothetical protein